MDDGKAGGWWAAWRARRTRAGHSRPDFGDHGTAFGLDASLERPHEPSSRLTGLPAASDFAPATDLPPESAR